MKKYFLFLLLMLPVVVFAQKSGCPYGDKYFPKCNDKGEWLPCVTGYSPGNNGKVATCVCDSLTKDHPDIARLKRDVKNLKASDSKQNVKIDALEKSDAVQNSKLDDHETRIKGLERTIENDLRNRPLDLSPKGGSAEYVPPAPKPEPEPKVIWQEEKSPVFETTEEVSLETQRVIKPWFYILPEVGFFWHNNKSPQYLSSNIWSSAIGVQLRAMPEHWWGGFVFIEPEWVSMLGKNFTPETTPSPYPTKAIIQNGFLAKAGAGWSWLYGEMSLGYAMPLSKGAKPFSGPYAMAELGVDKIPLKLQVGAKYEHGFNIFVGISARVSIRTDSRR